MSLGRRNGRDLENELEAEEHGVSWKAGFLGRHADVRWIVAVHIFCVGADDHCDDQYRSAISLFPAVDGAQVDKLDLSSANHP